MVTNLRCFYWVCSYDTKRHTEQSSMWMLQIYYFGSSEKKRMCFIWCWQPKWAPLNKKYADNMQKSKIVPSRFKWFNTVERTRVSRKTPFSLFTTRFQVKGIQKQKKKTSAGNNYFWALTTIKMHISWELEQIVLKAVDNWSNVD